MNDWLEQLDEGQLETLLRLLKKANPPPILHRYRGDTDWAVKEISNHEIHVPRPDDMNDPFEHRAPLRIDRERLKCAFEAFCRTEHQMDEEAIAREWAVVDDAKIQRISDAIIGGFHHSSGVVSFSSNPSSNRMWGYYAASHRGICISYDTSYHPFNLTFKVIYEDPDEPLEIVDAWETDCTKFCDHLARRKGKEWEFEQEYRLPVGPIPEDHTRLLPVDPASIVEVRLGVNIKDDFKTRVLEAISRLPIRPKAIQMSCDFDRFQLVESIVEPR
jgi:hypothetical protein